MLWVHAGNMARLEQGFRDIADHVKIPGRQDPKANVFRLVHDWLRDEKIGQWLLILDNVDNPDLLSEAGDAGQRGQGPSIDGGQGQPISAYLPQSQNGSILVTSRSQAVALKLVEEKDIVVVQPMTPAQALSLVEKKLGSLGQGDDTAELAAALDFMPLAIAQAAAYVSQKAPRYSVQQYLEDFRKSDRKRTSLLNHEGGQLRRDWQAQNSIIITWQISFEHIRQTRPSAADLLSLMSFFDRQGIPEALVRNRAGSDYGHREEDHKRKDSGGEEEEKEEEEEEEEDDDSVSGCSEDDGFEDDVQILRNYSFISVGTDRTFEMHALVQLATRKWLEANEKLEQWKNCYIKNLAAEFPNGEHENWTYCQTLFPHAKSTISQRPKAEGALREWASLLHNAAWYAREKGSITEAVEMSELAMKVRKNILGQEHEEALDSMGMVGLAYLSGGRLKEAEELQMREVEISKRVLGEEHPKTLTSISNLALTYWNQGRWKEAEELDVWVIEIMKKVLGEEDLDMLISTSNLALTYRDQGRWKEAEELQVRVMEISKRVQGEEHPFTLSSMNNLASTYKGQERWKESEELGARVLEIRKRVLGEEHPETLTSISNLAVTYGDHGRWKDAEELQVWELEISKRVQGEEHPNTLISMNNLASTYGDQERWKEAEKLLVQVLAIQKRVLGKEHPDTLISMNNLAHVLKGKGEDEKAIGLMEECVEKRKHALGQVHPDTKSSEDTLLEWRMESLHPGPLGEDDSLGEDVNSTAVEE